MFVCAMNFELPEMAKKLHFLVFMPNVHELGIFHPYFVCKWSFREILMLIMVILNQNKPIWLILKIQKSVICKLPLYYS